MPEADLTYADVNFTRPTSRDVVASDDVTYSEVKISNKQQPGFDMNKKLQTLKDEKEALRRNFSEIQLGNKTCLPTCDQTSTCPTTPKDKNEMCLNNRPEWERYQGKCYKFNTRKSSWTESRDSCRAQGGDLVKIDSRDEQIFLEIRLRDWMEKDEDKFWIGLTDSEEEDRWLWVDGSPLDESLTFWSKGEPDDWTGENPAGEDCVRMGEKGGADDLKCWFDQSCDAHHKSICEKSTKTICL
ncbi:immune-related, lectin-like receptor 4 isoform X2 [Cyprinodon tularosa]|uniref:immune-related, lectin-like receptor 4 isoform X2 n=1 Tax=Cyprinodon tularosa TaxID=77115 RepID=UPI0018E28CE7|nr:immune-related, lectin-like receptor 4 isoform X2 [Cyprinodon tularosa]